MSLLQELVLLVVLPFYTQELKVAGKSVAIVTPTALASYIVSHRIVFEAVGKFAATRIGWFGRMLEIGLDSTHHFPFYNILNQGDNSILPNRAINNPLHRLPYSYCNDYFEFGQIGIYSMMTILAINLSIGSTINHFIRLYQLFTNQQEICAWLDYFYSMSCFKLMYQID